MEVQKSKR